MSSGDAGNARTNVADRHVCLSMRLFKPVCVRVRHLATLEGTGPVMAEAWSGLPLHSPMVIYIGSRRLAVFRPGNN